MLLYDFFHILVHILTPKTFSINICIIYYRFKNFAFHTDAIYINPIRDFQLYK